MDTISSKPVAAESLRVLLLEDVATDAELAVRELKRAGLRVEQRVVDNEDAFREALREFQPAIILSDFSMPKFDGMWALQIARELAPDVPYIFVSGTIGEEYAIRALKNGATDYVLKSNLLRLPAAVERALQESRDHAAKRRTELELEETRNRLDGIVASLSDVVWSFSLRENRMLYLSSAARNLYHQPINALFAKPMAWLDAIHPEDRERVVQEWSASVATRHFDSTYRILLPDEEVLWIHNRGNLITDERNEPVRIDGLARDITLLKQQEQRIARLSRIHAAISDINALIVRVSDREQVMREACRIVVERGDFRGAWIGLVDTAGGHVRARCWAGPGMDFLSGAQFPLREDAPGGESIVSGAVRERRALVVNDISTDRRVVLREKLLAEGCSAAATLPLKVADDVVGVLVFYGSERGCFDQDHEQLLRNLAGDISFALDHIAKEEKLNYLAYYDPLTELPNRALFNDRLEQRISAARDGDQVFFVMLLDVERFRLVNDTLGRAGGDELLRQLAQRLGDTLQKTDLLGHFGGDHFALATRRAAEAATLVPILEQALAGVSAEAFRVGDTELRVAGRMGIAVYPADGTDVDGLVRNAEAALKDAQRTGQRFVFYAPQMNARAAQQLKLENDLRSALQLEQFVLHYQPRFDLVSGRLVGMEALIRWRHPERGMVSPGAFIQLLEETGLILEVGNWALKRAAFDHAAWRGQGFKPPRIAVNVSQVQLRRPDFVESVKEALADVERGEERIDIEITESMLMEDVESIIAKLQAVRATGLRIAIDDFGTGYSSLSYLARLPVDSLKIDRSFITQMPTSSDQMAIVSTVISLARALNLKVCAEGVETEEQANLLRLLRCDEVQGYLFGKPVPTDVIAGLLPRD